MAAVTDTGPFADIAAYLAIPRVGELRVSPDGTRLVATVSELDVVSFTSPVSAGFCWWGSACNLWPSRMQASYRIPGFRPVWRRRIYQFTVLRMVAVRGRARVTPATVAAVLISTRPRNDEVLFQR